MYGSDCSALNKKEEMKMEVAEMRMLWWMECGVNKLDKIRNESI